MSLNVQSGTARAGRRGSRPRLRIAQHSHLRPMGYVFGRIRMSLGPPVVTTLHNRLDLPQLQALHREFAEAPVVSISNVQRRPLANANWVANSIPLRHYTFKPRPGTDLAFLGRISPDKGVDTAIHIGLRAGLGQVGGQDKDVSLQEAAALLFRIRWPEPFGLVISEALACGTPVLALDCGRVPEVIRDGNTGFIRHTQDQLMEAVQQIPALDRACCRAEAERRFSARAMADGYDSVYARLQLGTGRCMPAQPINGRAVP